MLIGYQEPSLPSLGDSLALKKSSLGDSEHTEFTQGLSLCVLAAVTPIMDWVAYKSQKFIGSGGWKLEIEHQHSRVLERTLFWVARTCFSPCPHMAERGRELC